MSDAFLKPVIACNEDGHGASVEGIALEIWNERLRQDEKWGPQNHPGLLEPTREGFQETQAHFEERLSHYRARNDDPSRPSDWSGILLEEVYEALVEFDPIKLREELVQSAAVIAAWIEAIDRRSDD